MLNKILKNLFFGLLFSSSYLSALSYDVYYIGPGNVLSFDYYNDEQEFPWGPNDEESLKEYVLNNNGEVLFISGGQPHIFTTERGKEQIKIPNIYPYNPDYEIQNFTDDVITGNFNAGNSQNSPTYHSFAYYYHTGVFIDLTQEALNEGINIGNGTGNIIALDNGIIAAEAWGDSEKHTLGGVLIYNLEKGFTFFENSETDEYSLLLGNKRGKVLIQHCEELSDKFHCEQILYTSDEEKIVRFNIKNLLKDASKKQNIKVGKKIDFMKLTDEGLIIGQMLKEDDKGYGYLGLSIAFIYNPKKGVFLLTDKNDLAYSYPVLNGKNQVLVSQFNMSKKDKNGSMNPYYFNLGKGTKKIPFDISDGSSGVLGISHNAKGSVLGISYLANDESIGEYNLLIWDQKNGTRNVFDSSDSSIQPWKLVDFDLSEDIVADLKNKVAVMNERGDILVTVENKDEEHHVLMLVPTEE